MIRTLPACLFLALHAQASGQEQIRPGIDVLVVDHDGKPQRNAPVRVTWSLTHQRSSHGPIRRSGADGRVRLPPLDRRFLKVDASLALEVVIPAKQRILTELDATSFVNDPTKPIRLTLPACGSVRVYVVDKDKRPVNNIQDVWLVPRQNRGRRPSKFHADKVEGDSATFRFVEVGFEFEAQCRIGDRARPQKIRDPGPQRRHEMRVVTLEGVSPPPSVSFRLLDRSGQPIRNEAMGVLLTAGGAVEGSVHRTDAEGRWNLTLDDRFADADAGNLFVLRRGQQPGAAALRSAARVPLETILQRQPGTDLQLRDEDLLVAGTVVDPQGKPVAGVRIRVPTSYHGVGNRTSAKISGDARFFSHEITTGKDGRFEFRELDHHLDSLEIQLPFDFFRGDRAYQILEGGNPTLGSKDQRVVVRPLSTIRGKFKGLDKSQRFQGKIELRDKSGKRVSTYPRSRSGGRFEIPSVPPGRYRLVFTTTGAKRPFLRVDDIVVGIGQIIEDPRLQAIDMDTLGKRMRVRVVDQSGKPLRGIEVNVHTPGHTRITTTNGVGIVDLQIPANGVRLSIRDKQRRYRPKWIKNQNTDVTIQLERTWPFEVVLKNLPTPPDNLRLAASFTIPDIKRPFGALRSGSGNDKNYVQSGGRLAFRAEDPGMAMVRIWPHYSDDESIYTNRGGPTVTLRVRIKADHSEKQVFELKLDAEALDLVAEFFAEARARGKE